MAIVLSTSGHLYAAHAQQPVKPKGMTSMQTNQAAVDALSRITDGALLGTSRDEVVEEAYRSLSGVSFEGMALRAPAVVTKREKAAVAVVIALSHSAEREARVPPATNAIVLTNRADGSGFWVAPLFAPDPAKIPMPRRPPPSPLDSADEAAPIATTAVKHLELSAAGALPVEVGQYAVRVIAYDWRSNTAAIRVVDSQPGGGAAAKEAAAREGLRAKWAQASRGTPDIFPHFVQSPRSPALQGIGLAAAFPAGTAAASGAVPVHGVARLTAPASGGATQGPVAVEAAYVVLARPGILNPIVLTFGVPLYAAANGMLEGYFGYDLSRVARSPLPPARYAAYVILGNETAGPYPLVIE